MVALARSIFEGPPSLLPGSRLGRVLPTFQTILTMFTTLFSTSGLRQSGYQRVFAANGGGRRGRQASLDLLAAVACSYP